MARRTDPGRAALAALIALAALALIAGCGGSGGATGEPQAKAADADAVVDISGTQPAAQPVGEETAGSVASLVECRDWNGADEAQKLATLDDVRSQINLEDSGIDAPVLTDTETEELFDNACQPKWAQGFRLYKLYSQAAGFVPLKRVLDD